MNKKFKALIIIAGILTVLVTLGIGVPALMADDSAPQSTPPQAIVKGDGVIAGTAAILNISTENLTQAIRQATIALKGTKYTDDAFYGKVAEILGIEKATLEAAVKQAAAAILDKKVSAILDQAVSKGTITAQEKAEIETWFAGRPSAMEKIFNFNRLHGLLGWGKKNTEKLNNMEREEKAEKHMENNRGKSPQKTPGVKPTPTTSANATSARLY